MYGDIITGIIERFCMQNYIMSLILNLVNPFSMMVYGF